MIKIGTDCSGIEAPIQALIKMGIKYEHVFSSEINKDARKSLLANYSPKILYEDMTKERHLPYVDIYVCGFPCQPFSSSGLRKGKNDPRGNIFLHCVKAIKQIEPIIFILENVKGITTIENKKYFEFIKKELEKLNCYSISYMILNTKNYGIPQNRERLYIVGIKKTKMKKEFKIPEHTKCDEIETYIDRTVVKEDKYCKTYEMRYEQFKDAIFANLGIMWNKNTTYRVNPKYCTTITTNGEIWCIPLHRRATVKEVLSLQGFPKNFKQVVSDKKLKGQVGNSMSVNVLIKLIEESLESVYDINGK